MPRSLCKYLSSYVAPLLRTAQRFRSGKSRVSSVEEGLRGAGCEDAATCQNNSKPEHDGNCYKKALAELVYCVMSSNFAVKFLPPHVASIAGAFTMRACTLSPAGRTFDLDSNPAAMCAAHIAHKPFF